MLKNKNKILIVNNTGSYILKFRSELIEGLQSQGYQIHAAFPFDGYETQLQEKNVNCHNLELDSYSKNVITELRLLIRLIKLIHSLKLSLILPFTIKPVMYCSFASFFSSCKVISTITGMGKIYTDNSLKFRISSKISDLAYWIGFKKNTYVIFQNPDDQQHFTNNRILPNSKAKLVNGSGINLKKHQFKQRSHNDAISFIMVARILKEKGVIEFCSAAAHIAKTHKITCTLVGGEVTGNKLQFDGKTLTSYCADNNISYLGHRNDISELLEKHTVFVLPSYREGTPRSTLEALASGMPIITTDAPGTKETVINNHNGLQISARSASSLQNAMNQIVLNEKRISEMSQNSRSLAENKFDVNLVVNNYLEIISDAI